MQFALLETWKCVYSRVSQPGIDRYLCNEFWNEHAEITRAIFFQNYYYYTYMSEADTMNYRIDEERFDEKS